MLEIQEFYAGQKIFITGGTGFLGQILIEKLLRSCPDIEIIYILIRAKKEKNVQERIDALFASSAFDVLRSEYPDFSKKIVPITGDIAEEGLGLSSADRALVINEVSVIFHLAATVRFDEKLDKAVALNVNSVKYAVDLAKECKNLKAGVHVSTAYSNCPRNTIDEEMYPAPLSYDEINKIVKNSGKIKWSEEEMNDTEKLILGKWPNTYTFTKAIGEGVVAEYAKDLPIAVFRPSIVTNAYREPVPGWLSGPMGLPGMICVTGLGILHTCLVNEDFKIDVTPVDYVCNALISCAWETATIKRSHQEEIPVYNYVSGNQNPVTWKELFDRTDIFGRVYPTNSAIYYPCAIPTKSIQVLAVLEFFLHLIPALIIDSLAKLFGKEPRLYKLVRKIGQASRALGYFSTKQWDFNNQRIQNLWKRMESTDKLIFPFNIENVDWDDHSMNMIRGLRKYIVGDPVDNLKQARRRQTILYFIHVFVRLGFVFLVVWTIWKLFNKQVPAIGMETLTM